MLFVACDKSDPLQSSAAAQKLKVVATTGMVADLVRQVGGERAEIKTLMGPGVDPHVYKASSADAMNLSQADLIFYSGLRLEGRMEELFKRLEKSGKNILPLTRSIPKEKLLSPPDFAEHFDPHVWFDVAMWSETLPVILEGFVVADPEGEAYYRENTKALSEKLRVLDSWCKAKAGELDESKRILVTSHDAYNYFGRAYGFRVVGLQGLSTVSEAALSDMVSLVDFLKKKKIKAIFVESSVNPAAMKRVAQDSGCEIGGELFSDAIGQPGEQRLGFDVGTYEGAVKYNITRIVEALK